MQLIYIIVLVQGNFSASFQYFFFFLFFFTFIRGFQLHERKLETLLILQNIQTGMKNVCARFSSCIKTRSMRTILLRLRVIQGTSGIQRVKISLFEGVERRLHGDERRSRSWIQSESYDVGGCSWQSLVH